MDSNNTKKSGKRTRTSMRLGQKTFTSVGNIEEFEVNDDIETDDELYIFSDNDEMYAEFDDDLFNSYVNNGLEKNLEDRGDLSGYE